MADHKNDMEEAVMYSNESIENPYTHLQPELPVTVTNKPPGYLRLAPITNQ